MQGIEENSDLLEIEEGYDSGEESKSIAIVNHNKSKPKKKKAQISNVREENTVSDDCSSESIKIVNEESKFGHLRDEADIRIGGLGGNHNVSDEESVKN